MRERHPSYGLISFNRTFGDTELFGSNTPVHGTCITLRISAAHASPREDGGQWYGADKQLISVELSAAQFAQLLVSMDQGQGVPCTISRLNGAPVEPPSRTPKRTERVREAFTARLAGLHADAGTMENDVDAVLAEGGVSRRLRERVRERLGSIRRAVQDGIPHMTSAFAEATAEVETALHAEAASIQAALLTRLGLRGIEDARKLLGEDER